MLHTLTNSAAWILGCLLLLAFTGGARAQGLGLLGVETPSASPGPRQARPARGVARARPTIFLGRTPDGRDVATVLVPPGTEPSRVVDVLKRMGVNLLGLPFDLANLGTRVIGFETQWSPRTYWDGYVQAMTHPVAWVRDGLRSREERGVEIVDTWKQRACHPDETAKALGRISVAVVSTMGHDLFVTPYRFAVTGGSTVDGPTNQDLADSLTNWTLLVAGAAATKLGGAGAAGHSSASSPVARAAGVVANFADETAMIAARESSRSRDGEQR